MVENKVAEKIMSKIADKSKTCTYPGCSRKHEIYARMTGSDNRFYDIPFCKYHSFIIMGNHFRCTRNTKGEFKIKGPLYEVEIAEQVYAAIELIKSDKSLVTQEQLE